MEAIEGGSGPELNNDDSMVAEFAMQELMTPAGADQKVCKKSSLCQECSENIFRYQCPRCSLRTCSLRCCKAHKERTDCNGKRDRTKYLPLAHMNDGTIDSDYHFLEDVLGAVERAKRTVGGVGTNLTSHKNGNNKRQKQSHGDFSKNQGDSEVPHPMLQQINNFKNRQKGNQGDLTDHEQESTENRHGKEEADIRAERPRNIGNVAGSLPQNCWKQLGPKWRHFWQQTNIRGINVLLMPAGMQRRKANTSHIKKDIIYWKVDVRVYSENDVLQPTTVQSLKLSEHAVLLPELQHKIKLPGDGEPIEERADREKPKRKMHWMIQKLPSPSNRPCYVELSDAQATLQSTLKGMTLIEYPTIEAVPENILEKFPRAIEELARNETE